MAEGRNNTMKICLNLLANTAGGQLTRARAFLERFDRNTHGCDLLVLKEDKVLPEYVSRFGLEIVNVKVGLGRLKAMRRMAWENLNLHSMLRKERVDVYLTFSHYLPSIFPKEIPAVVGVSNLAPFSMLARREERWMVRTKMLLLRRSILASARRASSVIALSEACRQKLEQRGVVENTIETIPNGVDDFWSKRSDTRDAAHSVPWDRFFLYVSHFHRYKNHRRLLSAYAQLPGTLRREIPLILVGRPYDGRYHREILAQCERLGLGDQVVINPGVDAQMLRTLYQRATLFVFPSMIENCPNILLEAMAAGAPVLASNQRPMPEFGGEAAVYFDPLDAPLLANKMEELANSRERLVHMSQRSAALARQYSWDNFVRRVLRLCTQVSETTPRNTSTYLVTPDAACERKVC